MLFYHMTTSLREEGSFLAFLAPLAMALRLQLRSLR